MFWFTLVLKLIRECVFEFLLISCMFWGSQCFVSSALGRKKITLNELQSLVGSLNVCARAIPSAVAFNRRSY